jgi:hypothetical protein
MRIGQHVICIDDSILTGNEDFVRRAYRTWVKKDEEYIIREILDNKGIVSGILLEEVINPRIFIALINEIQEPAFRESRFKPLSKFTNKEEKVTTELVVSNFGIN